MRNFYAILVLFLTMGAGANIWGQAPGNTCATAVNLTLPAIGNTITTGAQTTCGRGNNVLAGFSSVSTSYGGGEDAYYSITVPAGGGNYTFTYAASGATWKILSIHSGCAPTTGNTVGGFVTGGATGGTTTTTLAAGSYILVIDTWPAPACGAFTLNITRNAPPPNPCASAINIPSVPVTNQALVCNATAVPGALNATNVPTACGAASNFYKGGQDAIYTFTPTASGNHTITYNGVTYSSIFVYSGACPASGGTCVGSVGTAAASQTLTVNMTAGVLYYIWFDTWPAPNSPCPGTFSIAPPAGAPANDLVCNATSISCGGTVSGTTIGATNSGTGENQTCGTNQSQPGVWYVVPGNGQTMTASLCATAWDSKISVFSGTNCSTLTCVGGNDDNGPACAGASASFSWASVSGLNYYILVHGFSSSSAFNLNLTCVASYNPCASTPTLSCGTPVTQTFASGSGASWSPGTCGFTTPGEERVFLFTAPTTGTYTINQTASYAYIDYFFKPVSGGCNATGWTCIDDLFGAMTSTGFALTAGVQYYILADPETTAGGNATFSITCPTPCAGTTVTVNMNDTFGDGWNGANLSIVDVNTNAVVGTYSFATGFSSSQTACLPDGCYRVVLNAGAFPTEVGWSLVSGATTIASASSPTAAPFNTTFTIGTGTCTPPANNNCTSATVVDLGVNPSQTISGSSTASTNDPVIFGANSEFSQTWLQIVVPCGGMNVSLNFCNNPVLRNNAYTNLLSNCTASPVLTTATNFNFTNCPSGSITLNWNNLPAGTYYYPMLQNDLLWAGAYTVNVIGTPLITPAVAPTTISGSNSICPGGSTTLTVSGGNLGTGGVANWYTGTCGGTLVGTGTSFVATPSSTTTYFVRYETACNVTTCQQVTVTVNPPAALSGTLSACVGSTSDLDAGDPDWSSLPTGGVVSIVGTNDRVHVFNNSGSFNTPVGITGAQLLVIGGGGGGGVNGGGGGGAGGVFFTSNASLSSGTTAVTIGAGGSVHNNTASVPAVGGTTSFGAISAGGGGGGTSRDVGFAGANGAVGSNATGSGGGGAGATGAPRNLGGSGTFNGGNGTTPDAGCLSAGGGGGGAGGNGGAASNDLAGAGGLGVQFSITGTPLWYAGGGGGGLTGFPGCGGSTAPNPGGALGGSGVGGNGEFTSGAPNTGSGGGAENVGADGVVIIRYKQPLWTSSNPAVATVNELTGLVTAIAPGTTVITYTSPSGCISQSTFTVNPNPTVNAGGALADICQGGTSAAMGGSVGGGATGGTWSGGAGTWTNANDPANATYTASAGESGTITLTLTTSGGSCGTITASKTITVNQNPTANAGGALAAICQGGTSAAMGGSVGGGATGGTWSGGAGTWTNANDPANATYTASAGESGTITLTLTTSGGSCGTTFVTKTITVDVPSVAASSINNLNPVICYGGSMQLDVVGGSLAPGAQWEWFEGSCGSTVIGNGSSITVTPTGATDYYVRATSANSCAPTACTSISVTMPTTSTNLAIDGDVATCVVNSSNWIHFYDINGRLIASVNSNGQNLGNVTATSLVAGAPSVVTSCTQPWDPMWFNAVLARTFEISPTTQPTNPVGVRLYITDAEFLAYQSLASTTSVNINDDVMSIADLGLTKHSGAGVNGDPANICNAGLNLYIPQTTSGNTSSLFAGINNSYFIEYTISSFSSFFPMTSGNSPLPVTMTSFNANCAGDKVNVSWTTASEFNASHFSLQTSRDGQTWTEVAQIEAAGTTSQTTNYFYQDMMIGGVSYYRLVQVDFDGESEVFGPISVDCEINESSMTVYPNPTDNDFTVLIQTTETFENATIELVDLSGRSIEVKEMNIMPGSTVVKFETDQINPGTYIVRIKGENDKFTPIRVVIL